MRKLLALAAFALVLSTGTSMAQKLPDWQRVPFDDSGESASVELYKPSGEPGAAFFGYKCYNDPNRFGLDNVAYFLKLDNAELACMKNPISNVTLTIDGKDYPFVFKCDAKRLGVGSVGSLYFEWGVDSRADLNNMFELDQAIDKAKSKVMKVFVSDKNHYLFRGSLRNASIRKKVNCSRKG